MVGVLALSGCGSPPSGQSDPAPDGGTTPTPTPEPVSIAEIDHSQVEGLTEANFDAHGVKTTIPLVPSSRLFTTATTVVKDKMLRNAAHAGATGSTVTWQLVAASADTLGVMLTDEIEGGNEPGTYASTVWLDASGGQAVGSAALIDEPQWQAFLDAVREAAADEEVDAEALVASLNEPAAPYGNGPAMAFESTGHLVVRVPGESVTDLRVPAEVVEPMLSEFGTRARDASTQPSAFTGDAPAQEEPAATPTPDPEDTAVPDGTQTPTAERPPVQIGPDCTVKHCVALTYDDGPGPRTPEILEQLAASGAAATFFQLGSVLAENTDIGQQVVAQGQEVGNHSWSHPDLAGMGTDGINEELERTSQTMQEAYGQAPLLLRPPFGSHNSTVDELAAERGLAIVQWNIDTQDWQTHNAASTTASAVSAGNDSGDIVLMHDIHDATVDAAPEIYRQLGENPDVEMVTVSELGLATGALEPGHAYCSGPWREQDGFNCEG